MPFCLFSLYIVKDKVVIVSWTYVHRYDVHSKFVQQNTKLCGEYMKTWQTAFCSDINIVFSVRFLQKEWLRRSNEIKEKEIT